MKDELRAASPLRRISDIIEEIVSILITIGLIVYTQFIAPEARKDVPLILGGIVSIITLIAISNLRDRLYRFRRIYDAVEQTRQEVLDRTVYLLAGPDEFFITQDKSYEERLSNASSIAITGITLSGTIKKYQATLRERLEAGTRIQIIILDNRSDAALNQLVLRSWSRAATSDYYKGSLDFTSELIENIANTPKATGSLEIGYLPFVPSLGITLIDTERRDGYAFVEIYHHRSNKSPGFTVVADKDPNTFQLYLEQFQLMWKECRTNVIV